MNTALLIIDVQQALCAGPEAAFEIEEIIPRINYLAARARADGRPVFLIQHEETNGSFEHGSEGWQLAPTLQTDPTDLRIRKRTPDSFHQTDLPAKLQERGITDLIICGLQSDVCIDSTTRRALALGYNVTLVEDGHSTVDNGVITAAQITAHHNRILAYMNSFGPSIAVIPASKVATAFL